MHRIKLAVIAGGALFATPVFAQGTEGEATTEGTVEAGAGAEVGAEVAPTGMEGDATVAPAVETGLGMSWSKIAIERPYVRPAGKITGSANLGIVKLTFTNPLDPTMSTTLTGDAFQVGGAYGVTDTITAGANYAFTPGLIGDAEGDIAGTLDLFGEFQLVHSAKMSITASADFAIDLSGDETAMDIHAGLGARYNLAPQMAVFTGAPYGPGPVGRHLSISLNDGPITFDVPVGFMYQATPELNVNVQTAIANIAFNDQSNTIVFGADYIPLSLGALFSATPNIDVVGSFGLPDLKEAGFDLFFFTVGAMYHN